MSHAKLKAAAEIAVQANATVTLIYSPWWTDSGFPMKAPPTEEGQAEAAAMALYFTSLHNAKAWITPMATVGAVLLDQERWAYYVGMNASWPPAITRKNNLIYNATVEVFPEASIQLYGRGGAARCSFWIISLVTVVIPLGTCCCPLGMIISNLFYFVGQAAMFSPMCIHMCAMDIGSIVTII
jgi:hypothetical protein